MLLAGLVLAPQQGDFIAVPDDVHLVDGWQHRALHIWDLVVLHVGLRMKRGNFFF